ncbi:3'-5' exonuclease [Paracoccus aestuariivivens]|uniref:DNA-directed DNA polymerase n=1 Tax=Paracoccus aestuariivivens TaxID=1820333 RepID=A0A6L6JD39_9RHOB|nr:3'-5' exonuclease [Paracoccus aestuariivivens]MTH79125.1 3'-5' exonuclease [Paracoccus aestuariivivens]
MLNRLSLRLRIFLIFSVLLAGLLLTFGICLFVIWRRLGPDTSDLIPSLIAAAMLGLSGVVLLIVWIWYLFDSHIGRPMEMLAGSLRTGTAPEPKAGRYLGDLTPASREAIKSRHVSDSAVTEAVESRLSDLAREKQILESVLGDIGAIALMTDADDRVLFFNTAAKSALPGLVLGCALSRHLRPMALKVAERRLTASAGVTELNVMTQSGHRLSGTLRMVGEERVLILRPAGQPERTLAAERLRRHAATLVPILGAAEDALPPRVREAVHNEGMALISALREMETGPAGMQVSAHALAASVDYARLGRIDDICVKAEAGGLTALLSHLCCRLDQSGRAATLDILAEQDEALISLHWPGPTLTMAELDEWLLDEPDADRPGVSGAALTVELGSELWTESLWDKGRILMPLPATLGQCAFPTELTYCPNFGSAETLSQMTFVVFDTETTGLDQTDRIVQIAGLRIMAGRLTGERFETLVNPGRSIPAAATAIHHISDEAVASAPDLGEALAAFRHFTEGAVLVAHNAPFDMGHLRRAELETGVSFPNRVVDTVLLSAMLWGQGAQHTLDALADRLDVVISPEARHTAMGDAVATAEILLRMISGLEAKGLGNLEAISAEAHKYSRLIANADRA